MDIKAYLEKINTESQKVFILTIGSHSEMIGKAHHLTTCISDFSEYLTDQNEKALLQTATSQIESAILSATLGLYRQSLTSLRLGFEMALGTVYFSIEKLEHAEWLKGYGDIKWAILIDENNGILSKRFSNAFFPDLSKYIEEYNTRARKVYRSLSEFVHGNSETWTKNGINLKFSNELIEQFLTQLGETAEIILFALSCRYLPIISQTNRETMEFLSNELAYLEPIRILFGGPKA